jgi:hypothetical protein
MADVFHYASQYIMETASDLNLIQILAHIQERISYKGDITIREYDPRTNTLFGKFNNNLLTIRYTCT